MPKLGLTMTEGTLSEWRVSPGRKFSPGEILFVVETEKASVDVEATDEGVLDRILVETGSVVPVGTAVGTWQSAGVAPNNAGNAAGGKQDALPVAKIEGIHTGRKRSSPYARKVARSAGVDLKAVVGTGPGGRIKASDVQAAIGRVASSDRPESQLPKSESFRPAPQTSVEFPEAGNISARGHSTLITECNLNALLEIKGRLQRLQPGRALNADAFIVLAMSRAIEMEAGYFKTAYASRQINLEVYSGASTPLTISDAAKTSLGGLSDILKGMDAAQEEKQNRDVRGTATIVLAGKVASRFVLPRLPSGQLFSLGVSSLRNASKPNGAEDGGEPLDVGLAFCFDDEAVGMTAGMRVFGRLQEYLADPLLLLL